MLQFPAEVETRKEPVVRSLVMLASGGLLFWAGRSSADATLQLTAYMAAFFLLLAGVLKLFFRKTQYLYAPTKELLRRSELNLDSKEDGKVERVYANADYEALYDYRSNCNSAYRLVLYSTKSGDVSFSQLQKYVPFEFFPVTEVAHCEGGESQSLTSLLHRFAK